METRTLNLDYLNAVKSNTKAFIEIKRTLDLTPEELTLLGLTQAPEEIYSTIIRLKWDYKSRINDVRKQMGMPPTEHESVTTSKASHTAIYAITPTPIPTTPTPSTSTPPLAQKSQASSATTSSASSAKRTAAPTPPSSP